MYAFIDALTIAAMPRWTRNGANDNDPWAHYAGQSTDHPIGTAAYQAVDRVDGLLARVSTWRHRSRRRRHSIRELSRLDDHALADIGVRRADIASVVDRLIAAGAANDNRADIVA